MASGGARLRSGPAKNPNALRRDRDKLDLKALPAVHEGETPDWPLSRSTKRERLVWKREWRRPQGAMWEQAQQWTEVAMYVRQLVRCEKRDASAADRRLLQTMIGDLGLTQSALTKFGWRIGSGVETPSTARTDDPDRKTAKSRFKVIAGKAS